uniref:tetratricopeptide repeat protein n=1 Tax=Chamaesiphon sp. VAR_48_metabat_403 TaxID=2964700 RepID=UPI00286DE4FD
MARNLNVAVWLLCGTMTLATICESRPTYAYTIDPIENQTAVQIDAVDAGKQYQQGITAAAAGNFTQAISSFNRAITLNPQYFAAYIERGNVKDGMGDFAGAIADYTTAISIEPKSAIAYYNRATVLSKSNRHPAAIADYDKAVSIDP